MTGDFGEHRILRELARGGMGVLYEVEHRPTGARRALKTLLLGAQDPEERARFRREAQLLARLDHPAIVRIHEAVTDGPTPYLVQDLLPGGSLDARLAKGPLPIAEARAIAAALARGVEHAHARGVLHRDLKPKNVVFDDQGRPRLVDFGLARRVEGGSLTSSGTILGTPGYLPPEQANGRPADERSDVYGLGAVLYAMLVGRPPYEGTHTLAVLAAVIEGKLVPPRALRADVPPDLEAICLRALAADPAARFQTAGALATALLQSDGAPPRRGLGALLGAALVAGLTLGLALTLRPAVPAPPEPAPPPRPPEATEATAAPRPATSLDAAVVALARCEAGDAVAALESAVGVARAPELGPLRALAAALDGRHEERLRLDRDLRGLVEVLAALELAARRLEARAVDEAIREPDFLVDIVGLMTGAEQVVAHGLLRSPAPSPSGGDPKVAVRIALRRRAQRVLGRAFAAHGLLASGDAEQELSRWCESNVRSLGPEEVLHCDLLWTPWQGHENRADGLARLERHARVQPITGLYWQVLELVRLLERAPDLTPARGEALLAALSNLVLDSGHWTKIAHREVGRLHRLEAWRLRREAPGAPDPPGVAAALAAALVHAIKSSGGLGGEETQQRVVTLLAAGQVEEAGNLAASLQERSVRFLLQVEVLLVRRAWEDALTLLDDPRWADDLQERRVQRAHARRLRGDADWEAPLQGAELLPRWGIEWRTSDVARDVVEGRLWWPGRSD